MKIEKFAAQLTACLTSIQQETSKVLIVCDLLSFSLKEYLSAFVCHKFPRKWRVELLLPFGSSVRKLPGTTFQTYSQQTTSWVKNNSVQLFLFWQFSSTSPNWSWMLYFCESSLRREPRMKTLQAWICMDEQATECMLQSQDVPRAMVEGRQALGMRVKIHNRYSSCSQFKNTTVFVNLGIYTSLEIGEDCNKCISAVVYTFQISRVTQLFRFIYFFSSTALTWMLAQWLACFQLQVNANVSALATRTSDGLERCWKCAR